MKKDMKQTVEEAARDAIHAHYKCNGEYPCGERDYCEHCNGHNTAFDCCECGADEFKEGFISGAEWQSKQSPWISVNERLPEPNKLVLCRMVSNGDRHTLRQTEDLNLRIGTATSVTCGCTSRLLMIYSKPTEMYWNGLKRKEIEIWIRKN